MTRYKKAVQALKNFKQGMYLQGLHGKQPGWLDGLPENPTEDDILNTAEDMAKEYASSAYPDATEDFIDSITAFLACGINAWLRGCAGRQDGK